MPHLARSIGVVQATAMVVGTIIGASIFAQPSEITMRVPSLEGIVLVWLVCGLLTLFGALVVAELSSAMPETGGVYVFLRESFGRLTAFLWGWANFWSIHSGIIAAIATVLARYVGFFVPLDDAGLRVVGVSAILLISAINYLGVAVGSAVQTAFTIGKVGAIAILIVVGYALAPDQSAIQTAAAAGAGYAALGEVPVHDLLLALVAGLFAFGGWHMVTYAAGETLSPERTIPRAVLVGTAIVTVCYVALNAVYLVILPLDELRASSRVAADAAVALVGSAGGSAISALVIFSTFGALTGIILAGPRLYLSMASDVPLFSWLTAVHPRFRTPHRAILLQAVWASLLMATGTYRALFTRVLYTEWIFFALMALGVLVLRRRADYRPAYRLWGYPLVPLVFAVASLVIVVNQLAADARESLIGLALVATGLPVYHYWGRRAPASVSAPLS
jgi:APA family basic amino acid/polyamine antiporter